MTNDQDAARLEALTSYDVLDGEPRRELTAIADLAARLAGVPLATVNLFTAEHQHQVAAVGFKASVCDRNDAMCDVVLREGRPILLADASTDDRFAGGPFVAGPLGEVRFYASHPLVTPEGVILGTLCVFDEEPHPVPEDLESGLALLAERVVDLLELELTSRRLALANQELAVSNERLGAFAGQISHDLKNPLSAISMSLEMARDEVKGGDAMMISLIDRASRGAQRMGSMIGDLLDFARGGAAPDLRDVDMSVLMTEVLEDLDDSTRGAHVSFADLPQVQGDPVQLRAIMQNLVANALKFTTRAGIQPEIVVSATRLSDRWRIEVADNGPGVPDEARERIFEPFNRLDKTVPGTGIGLSACKRIIKAHGGRIGAENAPGSGTIVWFELPAA